MSIRGWQSGRTAAGPARPLAGLAALLLGAWATVASGADTALATNNCTPSGELRGDAERGAALHMKHCADCHGADGRANVIVMHMDQGPADQSDAAYMRTLTDQYLYVATCKGGLAVGKNGVMPAWGDVLSDQAIRDLIAHIRTFSGT
jgi:cytochrome c oxidase cbb3-type subunit 3